LGVPCPRSCGLIVGIYRGVGVKSKVQVVAQVSYEDALEYYADFAGTRWSEASLGPGGEEFLEDALAREQTLTYEVSKGSQRGEFIVVETDPGGDKVTSVHRLSYDPQGTRISVESDYSEFGPSVETLLLLANRLFANGLEDLVDEDSEEMREAYQIRATEFTEYVALRKQTDRARETLG
jgi:hypothetical protein